MCVVLGPYNYPAHLPNGHVVPALLAGNCVVLKPSEHAPSVAELMAELWAEAGLPGGVLAVVQGGREVAEALLDHPELDGVFLTGSAATGAAVHRRFAGEPQRILALEMGGNNPLVVHEVVRPHGRRLPDRALGLPHRRPALHLRAAPDRHRPAPAGDRVLDELTAMAGRITVGPPTDRPEPFMGPVISPRRRAAVLDAQAGLAGRRRPGPGRGARACAPGTGLLSPGLVDVTDVADRADEEIFGPLLQLVRADDLEAAIAEAARTAYGLAAGILTDDEAAYRRFAEGVRAGVVNWNHELVGASSRAPFGGVGLSGNHRPSALFAADYCSYPVASIERPQAGAAGRALPGPRARAAVTGAVELNLDGLVGPTHNYAGLSAGQRRLAGQPRADLEPARRRARGHRQDARPARPRASPRACCRPTSAPTCPRCGAWASPATTPRCWRRRREAAPELLAACSSASAMWAANAATVAPERRRGRRPAAPHAGQPHAHAHRSIEAPTTAPGAAARSSPTGRASPCTSRCPRRRGSPTRARPTTCGSPRRAVRPSTSSCTAAARPRRHRARWRAATGSGDRAVRHAAQHPEAVDAGAFHNDVVMVGHRDVLLCHERALADQPAVLAVPRRVGCAPWSCPTPRCRWPTPWPPTCSTASS